MIAPPRIRVSSGCGPVGDRDDDLPAGVTRSEMVEGAMSLYNYVADKDELLDGMLEAVAEEVEDADGVGWKTALRDRAASERDLLLRHR